MAPWPERGLSVREPLEKDVRDPVLAALSRVGMGGPSDAHRAPGAGAAPVDAAVRL